MMSPPALFLAAAISCLLVTNSWGHGRLMDPPARNAMWRFGIPNPVNYNDNELFCGGYVVQYQQNDGNCGVCGDNWRDPEPRAHEANGTYANGIIVKRYSPGQIIEVEAELTANHQGYFMVKLCANNNAKRRITQECLDEHVLKLAGTDETLYKIADDSPKAGTFRWKLQLPPRLTCTQCVMQWTYFAGNTWGACSDGQQSVGCGPQETFINCADVAIISNTGYFGPVDNSLQGDISTKEEIAKLVDSLPLNGGAATRLKAFTKQTCVPRQTFAVEAGAVDFCIRCLLHPDQCSYDKCQCIDECVAVGNFSQQNGADLFCHENCLGHPSFCPPEKCRCF